MEMTKKKRGGERLKIEAGGSGGIILIGGALLAAALGAALAAHRARGSTRGNRNCDATDKNKEEEKGLRSLLPSIEQQQKGEAVSVDCLVQENTSEKSEIGETIKSEGPGASYAESSAGQVVWLEEVIEQRQDSASVEVNLLEQDSEMTESFEDFHREEEFGFDSSVEIQETGGIQGSYKITEMIAEIKESEIEARNTGGIDGDVTGEEFSFWSGKPSTPEIHTEQNFIELVTSDVPDEKEKESCIGEDGEKREQGSQIVEASSAELSEDAAWPAMAIEQEIEISEKTDEICVSEGEENIMMLQDHIPSTNCIEQEEGQVSVGSSEEAQEKACDDFEMVAEILDIPHVEGEDEEEGSSMKSQEEIELQLEDVGERGGEELEGLRNSSVEFSDQAVWPEERMEQGKVDDSMSNSEMKHQPEIPRNIIEEVDVSICRTNYDNKLAQESISERVEINMPDNETSENLHKSEADHVEADKEADDEQEGSSIKSLEEEKMLPVEEESEGEESIETGKFSIELEKCSVPMYEIKQMLEIPEKIDEMVDEAHIEGTKNSTGGIQNFLLSEDKHKEVSADSSVEAQEKVYMNLDIETEVDLKHAVVKTQSYTDVAFNASQGQNQQDREESEISHVEKEEEGVEVPSVGSQIVEASSAELSEDASWPAMAIEQELEISEKTDDICVSEGEENIRMLQDHIPSTNCIEQEEGQVSVGSSEEAQEKACDDFEMVAKILDIPHVEGEDEEEGSSKKSQEVELQLEDVGERGGEELEGLRNSSVEFSDQAVWPEERMEQGKVDDSMSNSEMKHQPEISRNIIEEVDVSICRTNYDNKLAQESISERVEINMPDNETSENLHKSEADHVEADKEADDEQEGSSIKSLEEEKILPVEEESEGEESIETGKFSIELEKCSVPMYEMKQMLEIPEKIDEMVDEAHNEGTENATGGIQSFLLSDDKHKEVSADSSVEAQEKVYMNLDIETKVDLKHDVVKTQSYTDVTFNASQGQNQQDREESEISHVEEEKGVEDPSVGSQIVEASSAELSEDASWPAMAIEQELEISEKTDDICVSEGEENIRMLQDHIPSTNCIEQEEGQVSVGSSEEAQEKACDDFEMVAEILDIPHVEGEDEEKGSSMKSQEEIELQLEDVGERGGEELEGLRNSSVEFSDQAVWPEERIEQGKVDDSMSNSEMKHQPEIPRNIIEEGDVSICRTNYDNKLAQEFISERVEINMPDNETSENLHKSEADHVEADKEADDEQEGSSIKSLEEEKMLPVEEESEGEESIETGKFSIELEKCSVPMYEMKQMLEIPEKIDEMVDEAHNEGTENATGGIQSFLLSDDKHKEVSADSSVEAQEKVYMNLDIETEVDLKHDVVKTQSYSDVAFNASQGQNQQDREESQISHVEEEGVEDPSVGSQEEEKGLPSIENEMKLKFEVPKKTTDFSQSEEDKEEHEQEAPKKGSETIFTYKEKKTDFIVIGSSKLLLLVLITLAVGLLAFAHHDHLHHYNLRLPKIYRQLYQLFFPSYNRALGEL